MLVPRSGGSCWNPLRSSSWPWSRLLLSPEACSSLSGSPRPPPRPQITSSLERVQGHLVVPSAVMVTGKDTQHSQQRGGPGEPGTGSQRALSQDGVGVSHRTCFDPHVGVSQGTSSWAQHPGCLLRAGHVEYPLPHTF